MKNKKMLFGLIALIGVFAITSCKKVEVQYGVTFNTNGGNAVAMQIINEGDLVDVPANPTYNEHYVFAGWYTDSSLTNEFNFSTKITSDITLYAKWVLIEYTIKFQSNGGTSVADIKVGSGNKASAPTNPTKENYVFIGWYTDLALTNKFAWATEAITSDLTLYAKWDVTSFNVEFNTNGGSEIDDATLGLNEVLSAPTAPTKVGYDFVGWYKDADLTIAYDFTEVVASSLVLYAKWELRAYDVVFVTNIDGVNIDKQTVNHGDTALVPNQLEKEHNTFTGWYVDETLTTPYDFDASVTSDLTLYAGWELETCDVTFVVTDTVVNPIKVGYGLVAVLPNPLKAGYILDGWYIDSNYTTKYDEALVVTSDLTLYARFISTYDYLSSLDEVLIKDNFDSYDSAYTLPNCGTSPSWDNLGLDESYSDKTEASVANNHVAFGNGKATLVDTSNAATQLNVDFGQSLAYGIVEGYFETAFSNTGNSWTAIQFNGTSASKTKNEVFALRTDSGSIKYRLDGGSVASPISSIASANDTVYKVHFIFDASTGRFEMDINGLAFVSITSEIASLCGIRFSSSDSSYRVQAIDNLVIVHYPEDLASHKERTLAKLDALYEAYDLTQYVTNAEALLAALNAAKDALALAETNEAVELVYSTLDQNLKAVESDSEVVLSQYKSTVYQNIVAAYPQESYRINAELLERALSNALSSINAAADNAAVDEAAAQAVLALNAIQTDTLALADYKVTVLEDLIERYPSENYTISIDQYNAALSNATALIENATVENYTQEFEVANALMAAVASDSDLLSSAKENASLETEEDYRQAIEAVEAYEATNSQDYSAIKDELAEIKSEVLENILSAATIARVNEIVIEAQEEYNAIVAKANKTIEELRLEAQEELAAYVEEIISSYDEVEDAALIASIEAIVNAIDFESLESIREINDTVSNAKDSIDELVLADTVSKAKAQAILAVEEAYANVSVQNDLANTDIQALYTSALESINAATTVAAVNEIVVDFSDEINSIIAQALSTPVLVVNDTTFELSWTSVSGAESYIVYVNDAPQQAQAATSFTLNVKVAGEYAIRVVALGDDKYTSNKSNEIVLVAAIDGASQAEAAINLLTATTSDDGTVLTENFKTAETITVNGVVFNIAQSSGNMKIEKNGLKFQKANDTLSFTTTGLSKISIKVYVGNVARAMQVTGPNGLSITGLTKDMAAQSTTAYTASYAGSSIINVVILSAEAGTYNITNSLGDTVYVQGVTIEALTDVSLSIKA